MDNFWNEKMINEYLELRIRELKDNMFKLVDGIPKTTSPDEFKESKQPKPEWEILSFYYQTDKRNIATKASNGYYFHFDVSIGSNQEQMLQSVWKINSVKRLSDGEVFSIGDKDESLGIIDRFKIETDDWGGCYAYAKDSKCGVNLSLLKKVPQPKPLFSKEQIISFLEKNL